MSNELGRLTQSFGEAKGSNTFFFIPKNKTPQGKQTLALEQCVPQNLIKHKNKN